MRPNRGKVIVKKEPQKEVSDGGIILRTGNAPVTLSTGVVLEVGPGITLANGDVREPLTSVKDRIMFQGSGVKLMPGVDDDIVVIGEDDILATF